MNKVSFPDLAPSVCFMCEQVDADSYIDTLRNWEPGGPTTLTGRKYICSNCVSTFASFYDWASPEQRGAYENEIEALKMAVEDLEPDASRWRDLVSQIPIPEVVVDEPEPTAKRGRPRRAGVTE